MTETEPTPGSNTGRSGGARPQPFFLDLAPEYRDSDRAAACILPVPYDATSSWLRGAARGAAAIISASNYVEVWDIETGTEPYRQGIATLCPVEVDGPPEALAEEVEHRVGALLDRGQLPVMLGGEHSVTVGAVRAAATRTPGLYVLQIDAHSDTREAYGGSAYNHACVMARVRERCPMVQVGIRSLDTSEVEGLQAERVFFAHEIAALLSDEVYVTIDLDAFDPSLVPATGTPEPGGLFWWEVNALLGLVARSRTVVGFDVVELLDLPGHHASAFTAAKLVHRFLAEIFAARSG